MLLQRFNRIESLLLFLPDYDASGMFPSNQAAKSSTWMRSNYGIGPATFERILIASLLKTSVSQIVGRFT